MSILKSIIKFSWGNILIVYEFLKYRYESVYYLLSVIYIGKKNLMFKNKRKMALLSFPAMRLVKLVDDDLK